MPENKNDPFKGCATGTKRRLLAERFTQYLNTRDTKKHAFPVNLNGAWGTGKTFFVDNWKLLVEEQGHIGIKIDAWESDYLDDPLTIIIAEIIEQLEGRGDDAQFHNQEKKVANVLVQLKSALPAIAKALIGIFLGKDTADGIGSIVEAITKSGVELQKYESDLNIGDLGLEATRAHKRHKQFIKAFKDEVGKLVDIAQPDKTDKKVFLFIDELDRCRPTYAIEMLETVKHLFDIPNFVFVFSTDTKQLQHSIKAVYGQDFDSHEYLSRFFEQRLTLPEPDYFEFLKAQKIFESVDTSKLLTLPQIRSTEDLQYAVSLICRLNKDHLPLRRVKQLCTHLESLFLSGSLDKHVFSIFTITGLVFGDALYSALEEFPRLTPHQKAMKAYMGSEKIVDFNFSGSYKMTSLIQELNSRLNACLTNQPKMFNSNETTFTGTNYSFINADWMSMNSQINYLREQPKVNLLNDPAEMLEIIRSNTIELDEP